MFDFSGISGFMSGVTGLGYWTPNLPVPNYGDYQSFNQLFQTTLGPQGLQGMPGAPASINANFSGYAAGGSTTYDINGQCPIYNIVYDKVPVYQYNTHFIDPTGRGPQLVMEDKNGCPCGCEGEIEGTDANGNETQYTNQWHDMAKTADANGDGLLTDDELSKVKMWVDTHHDGTVHAEDLKSLKDMNVVKVNLTNGAVMSKDLQGYQMVASQKVTGYFNSQIYANSGGSNIGFNYTPVEPTQSTQEIIAGFGSYPTSFGYGGYGGNGGYNTNVGAFAMAGAYQNPWSNQWGAFGMAGSWMG